MVIDTVSVAVCIAIVLLVIVSLLANPFMRKIQNTDTDSIIVDDNDLPKVSVLVLAGNNAKALDEHLPLILTQDYSPGYEVIVVGEQGDIPVESVMKQYSQNKHLYTTCIPPHSLFMSKKKLAVSLGVKAAHYDWIVMIDATCRPNSDMWLAAMARHMDKNANIVIGYSNYEAAAPSFYRFDRLRHDYYLLRCAQRSTAYRANGTNIAFRRSEFMTANGYRGNLQFVHGEYDFIVNKYARQGSARIAVEEEARVHEDSPTVKAWHERNVSFVNIRKYLDHSFSARCLYNIDLVLEYANICVLIVACVTSALIHNWIVLVVSVIGILATIAARTISAQKACRNFGEDISGWKTFFYEMKTILHVLATRIRYIKSDKREFSTHKL